MNASSVTWNDNDTYEYDLESSLASFDWAEVIPVGVVYGLTLLLGVTGNALILYTIVAFRRMRSITNVFLASLATADLLLVAFCVPIKLSKLLSFTWTFGEFLCKLVHYVQNVSVFCSVLTLTAMSLERFYAILYPMKAQYICTISQARKVIGALWALSLVMAVPVVFVQVLMPVGVPGDGHYWCLVDFEQPTLWKVYEVYMLVLVLIVPTTVMAYAYAMISFEVWRSVTKRRAGMMAETRNGKEPPDKESYPMTALGVRSCRSRPKRSRGNSVPSTDERTTVKQVVKMLVAVVCLFVLCWTPLLVSNVLTSFGYLDYLHHGYLKPLRTAFHLLAYANSCVNPIVYGFMSRTFRDSFLSVCRRRQPSFVTTTRTTSVSLGRSCSVDNRIPLDAC